MFRFEVIVSNIRRKNKILTCNNLNISEKIKEKKQNFDLVYYLVNYYGKRQKNSQMESIDACI